MPPTYSSSDDTPALRVRRLLRAPFDWFQPRDPGCEQVEYRAFLEQHLLAAQRDLSAAEALGDPARVRAEQGAVFVIAAGLGTFGDLDRVILALDHLPGPRYVRQLAGSLRGLLPLPPELDPVRDAAEVATWLRAQRTRLRWIAESHFELVGPPLDVPPGVC